MAFSKLVRAYAVYLTDGNRYLGEGTVKLPVVEDTLEEQRGGGSLGASPRKTGIENLEAEIAFNSYEYELRKLVGNPDTRAQNLSVRWSMQGSDGSTIYGVSEMTGTGIKVETDEFDPERAVPMSTLTFRIAAYKETIDGNLLYDIDVEPETAKYIVDGVDHWEPLVSGL